MMWRLCLLLLILQDATTHAANPLVMKWSSQAYGPDGPWQAVTIAVGSNRQPIDLYPGANGATTIFVDSICSNTTLSTTCYAARAGTYNQSESTTALALNQSAWETSYWNVQGGSIQGFVSDQVDVGAVVPNVSLTAVYQTYQTYPNGKDYPVPVGNLAIGGPRLKDMASGLSLNMIAAGLYTSEGDNRIPSYSYGLHIGSVEPAIPGSLVLGGYDKSRVLTGVSSQSVSLSSYSSGLWQIVLKDIGVGVATGDSPFDFTSKTGLFMQGNGAVLAKPVTIDPTKPYMYLPEATCDAITSPFPVSFDNGLGLYIWDTTHSNYANITSSATYISFIFRKDGLNDQTITVKVPLRLLTLTLQDPLVDRNATYFPCFHSTDTPVLGRPFLQAAFVGVNWFQGNNTGTWFLGQAPGPGLPEADITTINIDDTTLAASDNSWEESWAKHWSPLPESGSNSSNSSNSSISSTGGLSTGTKAGIGVGVGVAGVLLIAGGVWVAMIRRRRDRKPVAVEERRVQFRGFAELPVSTKQDGYPRELDTKDNVQPQELVGAHQPRHELE
ncbi:aspartic peptidase domain-containing protein [Aspergillus caelatus]|uniref:Aspartic peptidase domain-containing protein n=1 Tax=Aspergillus caelatus TaxID=61420 RepID=A0A5N7A540_9EURO|nr:aspartic peptidase domain-containing protein [Aspergillus caelatus]KAE8364932.1 aspartic peptidase domain-containing protein [Aspergillus caelatus]